MIPKWETFVCFGDSSALCHPLTGKVAFTHTAHIPVMMTMGRLRGRMAHRDMMSSVRYPLQTASQKPYTKVLRTCIHYNLPGNICAAPGGCTQYYSSTPPTLFKEIGQTSDCSCRTAKWMTADCSCHSRVQEPQVLIRSVYLIRLFAMEEFTDQLVGDKNNSQLKFISIFSFWEYSSNEQRWWSKCTVVVCQIVPFSQVRRSLSAQIVTFLTKILIL